MPVLFDSGIRSGADIVKALALGADAVLLGRPYLWGLALDGQAGVETVLRMLLAELDLTLALSGCAPRPSSTGAPCPAFPPPLEAGQVLIPCSPPTETPDEMT